MQTVFITGANRSGTTWLGKMLALSGNFVSVYEPFNHLIHRPGILGKAPFADHYHFVLDKELPGLIKYVNGRILHALVTDPAIYTDEGRARRKLHKIYSLYRGLNNFLGLLLHRKRILIKDPIALLSADRLAQEYSARVIVLIRHPAAYVSSIKRLDWDMSLTSFSNQPEFMATLPQNLASEIREQVTNRLPGEGYNLEDAALSWKVFHYIIHRYREHYPEWLFIRHEDLCENYIAGFEQLYRRLSLPFTDHTRQKIQVYCSPKRTADLGTTTHVLKRDSGAIPDLWKQNLDASEVKKIRAITAEVADLFYADDSWT